MARKHRKLFPMLAETNKTLDCSVGICDPACPYNCYPYPYYYTISPSPHPDPDPDSALPPAPPGLPPFPAIYPESPQSPLSSHTLTIIAVTSAVFLILLTGFVLAVRFASNRVNHVNRDADQSDRDSEEFLEEEQVDHPIWFIRTIGLQQSVINSITICRYKRGDGLIERTDCPVCLNEFEEHESLRLLPKCNHAFHISCIDTWLRSHTNCPLCRASVVCGSAPVIVSPEDSAPQTEIDGDSDEDEGGDGGQADDRDESGRYTDVSVMKEPMSSNYGDSPNPNSDLRLESCRFFDGPGPEDESKIRDEQEGEEQSSVLKDSLDPNPVSSIKNQDFPGKSCQPENKTEREPETKIKHIGEQASCSGENSHRENESWKRSDSMDSGESNGAASDETAKSLSGILSNTSKLTGSSRFSRNMSSVFPL